MSKFLHRDAMHEEGAPSEQAFSAADRIGIRWPELPWICPGCGTTYESHKETIATIDLELAVALKEILRVTPTILASPHVANMPKTRRAVDAFAEYLKADVAEHGPPAVFLCIGCDLANHLVAAVHVLVQGVTLCGIRDLPPGHKWVRWDEPEHVSCLICKQILKKEGVPCPD